MSYKHDDHDDINDRGRSYLADAPDDCDISDSDTAVEESIEPSGSEFGFQPQAGPSPKDDSKKVLYYPELRRFDSDGNLSIASLDRIFMTINGMFFETKLPHPKFTRKHANDPDLTPEVSVPLKSNLILTAFLKTTPVIDKQIRRNSKVRLVDFSRSPSIILPPGGTYDDQVGFLLDAMIDLWHGYAWKGMRDNLITLNDGCIQERTWADDREIPALIEDVEKHFGVQIRLRRITMPDPKKSLLEDREEQSKNISRLAEASKKRFIRF
ncbi:hypothetical protein SBOR_7585 [Sclerotinia borealis F-4128]|uniref:Uncharacterized protein n=1 Tax=Sclerotinia borealis (strain F-4128) TaxID=1432307 RepID=W9CAY0_SCLBF|nr:hypothetical protein SBOR_7585 [Sclerotinia borealis F-4128]